LERIGLTSQIHEQGYRNQPLTAEQNAKNRIKSQVRAKVEQVFGQWVMGLGGKFMRLIGKTRVPAAIGLKNRTYNFRRYAFWERPSLADNL